MTAPGTVNALCIAAHDSRYGAGILGANRSAKFSDDEKSALLAFLLCL